jgi:hypothetical protein
MVVLTSPKHLPTLEHLNETGLKSNKTQRKNIQSFFQIHSQLLAMPHRWAAEEIHQRCKNPSTQ